MIHGIDVMSIDRFRDYLLKQKPNESDEPTGGDIEMFNFVTGTILRK